MRGRKRVGIVLNAARPPLFEPDSGPSRILKKLYGYSLTSEEQKMIMRAKTDYKVVDAARGRIIGLVREKIAGGRIIADELEELLHPMHNAFVMRSGKLTGTGLMRLSIIFANYGERDIRTLLKETEAIAGFQEKPGKSPPIYEFLIFLKFLRGEVMRAKGRKNLYEQSRTILRPHNHQS